MNPLTQVKRTQQINLKETSLGISEEASWHSKFKSSAYIFVGGIPFDLTEGDLLAVFAQYGDLVDVNLVRDKATGKSRGFAFLAYEDQRSTVLAVDNLNGAKVLGRVVRVDHVANYRKKEEEEEEDPEEVKRKRESRGVCYAFQKGECNRGASCKFSHDEQRNANTGWGSKDDEIRWVKDKGFPTSSSFGENKLRESKHKSFGKDESFGVDKGDDSISQSKYYGNSRRDRDRRGKARSPDRWEKEPRYRDDRDGRTGRSRHTRERTETHSGIREGERHRRHDRDSSNHSHKEDEREHKRRSHR